MVKGVFILQIYFLQVLKEELTAPREARKESSEEMELKLLQQKRKHCDNAVECEIEL